MDVVRAVCPVEPLTVETMSARRITERRHQTVYSSRILAIEDPGTRATQRPATEVEGGYGRRSLSYYPTTSGSKRRRILGKRRGRQERVDLRTGRLDRHLVQRPAGAVRHRVNIDVDVVDGQRRPEVILREIDVGELRAPGARRPGTPGRDDGVREPPVGAVVVGVVGFVQAFFAPVGPRARPLPAAPANSW